MVEVNQVYKCNVCCNIVEVVHASYGTLVCCGKPMELLQEKTADSSQEKHVPVIETTGGKTTVKVGSVPHPMEENHYIEWIELVDGEKVYRAFLKAGEKPEAIFNVDGSGMTAREYCSVHGLWKS